MRITPRAAVRGAAALGLAGALAVGGATGALADTEPTSEPSASATEEGYSPDPVLEFEVLNPVCDGDVPYLQYSVVVTDPESPPTSVTITFVNPNGENFVLTDLPLSGRVLWPGAVVDADGNPLDWPGWSLVDGVWVEGDEWDWVRPEVEVLFEVNPTATTTVGYPPSSPNCATDPQNPGPSPSTPPGEDPPGEDPPGAAESTPPGTTAATPPELPMTGPQLTGLIALAAGLLTAGLLTVVAVRRRRGTD